MREIKFSHSYEKLKRNSVKGFGEWEDTTEAKLLDVIPINLETLSKTFLEYDTDGGKYKLPKKGAYLMLIFQKTVNNIFTTLRRQTPEKEKYYRENIGNFFNVIVEKQDEFTDSKEVK